MFAVPSIKSLHLAPDYSKNKVLTVILVCLSLKDEVMIVYDSFYGRRKILGGNKRTVSLVIAQKRVNANSVKPEEKNEKV